MAQSMSASMSKGQARDLGKKVVEAALAHLAEMGHEAAQQALGHPNIGTMMFAKFKEVGTQLAGQVVRLVRGINRSRTPEEVLIDTGRKVYSNPAVVATMPRGTKSSARLHIFDVDKSKYKNGVLTCAGLAEEFKQRGLRADVEVLADYLKKNPAAADEKWLACQWVDADGNYCCAAFSRWGDERYVNVDRRDHDWDGDWSFAGVPQES
jgi:hypothetical protein